MTNSSGRLWIFFRPNPNQNKLLPYFLSHQIAIHLYLWFPQEVVLSRSGLNAGFSFPISHLDQEHGLLFMPIKMHASWLLEIAKSVWQLGSVSTDTLIVVFSLAISLGEFLLLFLQIPLHLKVYLLHFIQHF